MHEKKRHPKQTDDASKGPQSSQRLRKRSTKKPKREGKSIRWMVIALLVAVALMGWAIAAASYASDVEGFQKPDVPLARVGMIVWLVGGLAHFLWNAVVQIPNAHRVAAHTVTQHPVLLLLIALSAVGVGLFGWLMSRLERQFAKEDERFRRMSENG
jgi:cytochrome bd-type quinol oxidase subunit 2